MDLARRIAWVVVVASTCVVAPARALPAPADTLRMYELATPPSEFRWGCFPPCMCPPPVDEPLSGTFRLVRRGNPDPVSQTVTYAVMNLRWLVTVNGHATVVTGGGTYTFAPTGTPMDHLVLDLAFDDQAPKHFDSGSRPAEATFPDIRTRLSLHGEHCRDSLFVVQAHPIGVVKPIPRAARGVGEPRSGFVREDRP
jgi:hypothetical protein